MNDIGSKQRWPWKRYAKLSVAVMAILVIGPPAIFYAKWAVLSAAIASGNPKRVEMDLRFGCDADYGLDHGEPLQFAASRGDLRVMKVLLDHGANPNAFNAGSQTDVLEAACSMDRVEAVRLLLRYGAMPDCVGDEEGSCRLENHQIAAILGCQTDKPIGTGK